jgi:hypothetical protein
VKVAHGGVDTLSKGGGGHPLTHVDELTQSLMIKTQRKQRCFVAEVR